MMDTCPCKSPPPSSQGGAQGRIQGVERSSQNCSVERLFTQWTTEGLPEDPLGRWRVSVSATHVSHPDKIVAFLTTGETRLELLQRSKKAVLVEKQPGLDCGRLGRPSKIPGLSTGVVSGSRVLICVFSG